MKGSGAGLSPQERRLLLGLFASNLLSVSLFLVRIIGSGVDRYGFMIWNLFLAWLPLLLSTWLVRRLVASRWLSWQNVVLTLLWLVLLPNSFYMITDLIHLQTSGEINVLFDTVLLFSFIFNGLIVGYISLYQVHLAFLKRLARRQAHGLVTVLMIITGFAIYLGRDLRWNSWDIMIHPGALLFDISDRLLHPINYPDAFLTTVTFWLLLGAMYVVAWQLLAAGKSASSNSKRQSVT